VPDSPLAGRRFRAYTAKHLDALIARAGLDAGQRLAVQAVATVLPFRTNAYVIDELIDWAAAPDDPIYRLVFPQADMLPAADVRRIAGLLASGAPDEAVRAEAHQVRMRLNPHPAGQLALNIPDLADGPVPGIQHKYPETVLVFPKQGQTCHAYCTYCFRWAQFVDEPDLKMATADVDRVIAYLRTHQEVTSVLITGGDPMIMGAPVLRRYIEPLLDARLDHIESIRIGTKSLAYWPQRFVSDPDADDTLRLFEEVTESGRTLAFMAHFSHPRELEPEMAAAAVRRIRSTGAVDPDAGATDPVHQRRPGDLVRHVAVPGPDGDDPLLHVRRAGHRAAGLLRGSAGPCLRGLRCRLPERFRPVPDGTRPLHVGDAGKGMRGRRGGGGRRESVRPAPDPGAGS
jgi:L-lysine 2,3-aminomutase